MIKLVSSFIAVIILATTLSGCENTVSGFGKDMQSAGKNIENTANN